MNLTKDKKDKIIVACAIASGMLLYVSKFLRRLTSDDVLLFILGFLPNFGLAFALPFIYLSNRIRLNKPPRHFRLSCVITFVLMLLNEVRDKFQSGRVFDLYDVYASFAGVVFAYLVVRALLSR